MFLERRFNIIASFRLCLYLEEYKAFLGLILVNLAISNSLNRIIE